MLNLALKPKNISIALLVFLVSIFIFIGLSSHIVLAKHGDDSACAKASGTCQFTGPSSQSCSGTYQSGLCLSNDAADYQCCVTKGIFTPIGTSPGGTYAPLGQSQTIKLTDVLGLKTFEALINKIIDWLLIIGAPILTLMIIVGSFQVMTAAGNPEKIVRAKKTILYSIVGYGLLFISKGIILIIEEFLK